MRTRPKRTELQRRIAKYIRRLLNNAFLDRAYQTAVFDDLLDKGREGLGFKACARRAVVDDTVV